MPVWWTKRSLPPSSGVTKPKPLSSLNHFTVPVAMIFLHGACALRTRRKLLRQRLRALNTLSSSAARPTWTPPSVPQGSPTSDNTARAGPARPPNLENNVCWSLAPRRLEPRGQAFGSDRRGAIPPMASMWIMGITRRAVIFVLPERRGETGRGWHRGRGAARETARAISGRGAVADLRDETAAHP